MYTSRLKFHLVTFVAQNEILNLSCYFMRMCRFFRCSFPLHVRKQMENVNDKKFQTHHDKSDFFQNGRTSADSRMKKQLGCPCDPSTERMYKTYFKLEHFKYEVNLQKCYFL